MVDTRSSGVFRRVDLSHQGYYQLGTPEDTLEIRKLRKRFEKSVPIDDNRFYGTGGDIPDLKISSFNDHFWRESDSELVIQSS